MIETLDHVVIAVEDLQTAERTAIAVLGRSPSWAGTHPSFGTANRIFKLENTYVELLAPIDEGLVADGLRARLRERGPGLHALAFGTRDAAAEAVRLRAAGLSPSEPITGLAHDTASGAFRRFRNVMLPTKETHGIGIFVIEQLSEPELLPPALPISDEAGVASRIDHVVVMTDEPDRAKSLYGDQLGLRLALDRSFEKRGVRLLFFRVGGATIEIGASLRAGSDAGVDGAQPDRFFGVAYQVRDIEKARARLVQSGLEVSGIRDGHKAGTRVCTIEGRPLGVPTLIIEPVHD